MITKDTSYFRKSVNNQGNIVSLDYSQSVVGVAISDTQQIIASPLCAIQNSGHKKISARLQHHLEKRTPIGFIIGWPLNFNGEEGAQCEPVRRFAEFILAEYALPILLMDERFTSKIADTMSKKDGKTFAKRKHIEDKVAASLILTTYLEGSLFT